MMEHIEPERLYDAASGQIRLNESEAEHLAGCEHCAAIFGMFKAHYFETSGEDAP
jgi:hypothetical protein